LDDDDDDVFLIPSRKDTYTLDYDNMLNQLPFVMEKKKSMIEQIKA
jgi:hypothetical protein